METSKSPNHFPWKKGAYLVCVAIVREDGTSRSWLFNHPDCTQSHGKSIKEIQDELEAATRIVAHNIKFDLLWLLHYGLDISKYRVYCTQVAEYILRSQKGGHGQLTLEQLSKDYGISDKIDKVKTFWESGYETDEIPSNILLPYCIQDCINTLAIYQRQSKKVVDMGLTKLVTLQCELSKILANIEYNGMKINKELIQSYGQEYGEKINNLNARLEELFRNEIGIASDVPINLDSNEHLSACLFGGRIRFEGREEVRKLRKDGTFRTYQRNCVCEVQVVGLGFRPEPKSETKKQGVYSVDLETLKSLKCKTSSQREVISILIEKSRLGKMKSTYVDGLLTRMEEDDRVHPSVNQTITKTGRLSSSNPNLQNIPRGSTGGIKNVFLG